MLTKRELLEILKDVPDDSLVMLTANGEKELIYLEPVLWKTDIQGNAKLFLEEVKQ